MNELAVFGLSQSRDYADAVCKELGVRRYEHVDEGYGDGEPYIRSDQNVRGRDVFVISSLFHSEEEELPTKFLKLLVFVGSLRDASARRVTMVFPYLAFQRLDRKDRPRSAIYTKTIPMIIESVCHPTDRTLVLDPHNLSAFQSGMRLVNDHLESKFLICGYLLNQVRMNGLDPDRAVVLSPDEGGLKRARFFRDAFSQALFEGNRLLEIAHVDKIHEPTGKIKANMLVGNVKGKQVIVYDDMISSGKTMVEATDAVEDAGGQVYACCASHGLFVGDAEKYTQFLLDRGIKIVVTDSVIPMQLSSETRSRLAVVSTVRLIASAISRIHNEQSVSSLLSNPYA